MPAFHRAELQLRSIEIAMGSNIPGPRPATAAPHAVQIHDGYTQDTRDAFDMFIDEGSKR